MFSILLVHSYQKPDISNPDALDPKVQVNSAISQSNIDLSVEGDYEVRDGMFYFKNYEAFAALDKALRAKSPEDRIAFTNKLGFTSLPTIQLALRKSLSEATSLEEYNKLISDNKDVFKLEGTMSNFDLKNYPLRCSTGKEW